MHELLTIAAAFAAGAINSIAGGGTLITYPALVWLGLPENAANATSKVALWPGSLGSVYGFRRELREVDPRALSLALPSLAGGVAGAVLLQLTPNDVFKHVVPFLILFGTFLFMAQEPLQRRFNLAAAHEARSHWLSWTMVFQLGVAVYGGYFGAGIGILMLAALSLMGHTDIHRMNALKNLLAVCINSVAGLYLFLFSALVVRRDAVVMAAAAIAGGIAGAGAARRMGRPAVRRVVVVVGLVTALDQMRRVWLM